MGWWMDAAAVALFAAVVVGLILLSIRSPLHADDYSLLVSWRDHPFLADYLVYWYTTLIGRLSPLVFMQVALRFPLFWGIVNGLAVVALVVMTFAVAMARWPRMVRRDLQIVAVLLAAYWLTLPAIGETVFWRTGAAVYLWPTWLMLLFVFPYRRWMSSPTAAADFGRVRRLVASLGWFALGFVVGCSHEQLIVALSALFVAFAAKVWRRGLRAVPIVLLAGVVGAALGATTLVLAPGNDVRFAAAGAVSLTILARAHGFATYLANIVLRWLPPIVPWLLCLLVTLVPVVKEEGASAQKRNRRPHAWWIWGVAGVATLAPFVIAPGLAVERTFFFLPVFLTVSVVSLGASEKRAVLDLLPRAATSAVIAGLMLLVLVPVVVNVRGQARLNAALHDRELAIATQKARGVQDVIVPPIILRGYPYRAIAFFDMTADRASYISVSEADWYGVRTMVVGGDAKLY